MTIRMLLEKNPRILVECLTGDFAGSLDCIALVVDAGLHVYAHNVETVEELTSIVRDRRAAYRQSLRALAYAKQRRPDLVTKSSIMLGFGETDAQVRQTLQGFKACLSAFRHENGRCRLCHSRTVHASNKATHARTRIRASGSICMVGKCGIEGVWLFVCSLWPSSPVLVPCRRALCQERPPQKAGRWWSINCSSSSSSSGNKVPTAAP